MRPLFSLLLFCFFITAERAFSAEPAVKLSSMRSSDGIYRVYGRGLGREYSRAVLSWVDRQDQSARRYTGLSGKGGVVYVYLYPSYSSTTNLLPRSETSIVRDKVVSRIHISAYSVFDLSVVLEAFSAAFLQREVCSMAQGSGGRIPKVPRWVSCGVSQALKGPGVGDCNDDVISRWYSGELPPLASLLAMDGSPADADPSLSLMLIEWMKNGYSAGGFFTAFFRAAAKHGFFAADSLTELLSYGTDMDGLISAWDTWLLARRRCISVPGVTTRGEVIRFRSQRLISASDSFLSGRGLSAGEYLDPSELLDFRESDWARNAARNKSHSLTVMTAGRDPLFEGAVNAFCRYYDAIADGASVVECEWLLHRAEALQVLMEALLNDSVMMEDAE